MTSDTPEKDASADWAPGARAAKKRGLDWRMLAEATLDSFRKLDPRKEIRNPVMFVVWVGALLTLVLFVQAALGKGEASPGFILAVSLWLWFTVIFANFAEAVAEGRGRAQAESLRKARKETVATKLSEARRDAPTEAVSSALLRRDDLTLVEAGELIPADGEDKGGITESVSWKGGGGFRYFRLAPSLLEKDKWGNYVINKQFNAAMLAEALCKLEGFVYAPSDSIYWQHGNSTERDFIYVTTQTLTHAQLEQLSEEVGSDRSLLVLCAAFRGSAEKFPNLTVKKIPKQVLSRCEWGHDDYSLKVENLPKAPKLEKAQTNMFDEGDE